MLVTLILANPINGVALNTHRSSSMVNDFCAPVTGDAKLSFMMTEKLKSLK